MSYDPASVLVIVYVICYNNGSPYNDTELYIYIYVYIYTSLDENVLKQHGHFATIGSVLLLFRQISHLVSNMKRTTGSHQ